MRQFLRSLCRELSEVYHVLLGDQSVYRWLYKKEKEDNYVRKGNRNQCP